MIIKMKTQTHACGMWRRRGEVFDTANPAHKLDTQTAQRWVKLGAAERVPDPTPDPEPEQPQAKKPKRIKERGEGA